MSMISIVKAAGLNTELSIMHKLKLEEPISQLSGVGKFHLLINNKLGYFIFPGYTRKLQNMKENTYAYLTKLR